MATKDETGKHQLVRQCPSFILTLENASSWKYKNLSLPLIMVIQIFPLKILL